MAKKEGWARYFEGGRFHYFPGPRSLCGKPRPKTWKPLGVYLDPDNGRPDPDDCTICAEKMAKRRPSA